MSEVWNFFGAKRHSVPHLGLMLKPKAAAVSQRTLLEWRGLMSAAADKGLRLRHDDAQLFALDREGRGQTADPLAVQFKSRRRVARAEGEKFAQALDGLTEAFLAESVQL